MYRAAMKDKVDDLDRYSADQFALQVTPNGNTLLHVAAEFNSSDCVPAILRKCPSLLHRANTDGDTPIHVAVARVNFAVVERVNFAVAYSLLNFAKSEEGGGPEAAREMLRARNHDGDTPLHLAASLKVYVFIDKLIQWKKDLIKEPDADGRTPLHYAAQNGDVEAVKKLLDKDESVAYVTANDEEGNTALHMATAKGDIEVIKELLSKCPDSWEMVNRKGRNILHISADSERDEATKYISEQPWKYGLVNRKDHEGNTPMHVLAQKGKQKSFSLFYGAADEKALNKEGLTPYRILLPKVRISRHSVVKILLLSSF
ncbi:hypothetical protein RHMOL_Rhmol04G0285700 [Rhododendron molle]|uniref:Uncharacterized protein n=1 Tax=Rhododendron molle TaxID=49168 RepID=A0ACC0P6I8_RHOML|nr:hypothetical protein RHMOL_Rhmol04G0285700 [Rhododendron molle]